MAEDAYSEKYQNLNILIIYYECNKHLNQMSYVNKQNQEKFR